MAVKNKMITIENYGSEIMYWGRDKNKEVYFGSDKSFEPYFYYKDNEGKYITLFGEKCSKKIVNLPSDVPKIRNSYQHLEADVIYVNRYLIDKVDSLESEPIRICYIDIETWREGGISDTIKGKNKVLSIVCYDSFNNEYTCFSDENEIFLLTKFINYISETDPDILTGWNFTNFDMPCLLNRMKVLNLNLNKLSRLNKQVKCFQDKFNGWVSIIHGRIIFDLLRAYKKLTEPFSGRRESYSLEYISKYELKETKQEFEGNLNDLYKTDINKFLAYNKRDVELLVMLDKKLQIIEYFDNIRRFAFCRFEDVFMNSRVVDCLILKEAKNKYILPSKTKRITQRFEGAYIKNPKKGLHKNIICFDFKGLYPSIMCQFCMSPESVNSFNYDFKLENGVTFKKGNWLIPSVVKKLFKKRSFYKSLREEFIKNSVSYKTYDNLQYSVKTILNSIYGVLGHGGFRLFKKEISESITLIARNLVKHCSIEIERLGYEVIYNDTDSIYILSKKNDDDEIISEANKICKFVNNEICDEFVKKYGCEKNEWLSLEFEKVAKTGIFTGVKKRYAFKLCWKNGKTNEIEIVGFEERRSDSPQVIRDFQKDILTLILNEASKIEVENFINNFLKKFETLREEIGIPCTITKPINYYKNKSIHVRAAEYSNKYHNTEFNDGSKFKYIYIYNFCDVVAFDKKMPEKYEINYNKMRERLLYNKVSTVFNSLGWISDLLFLKTNKNMKNSNLLKY